MQTTKNYARRITWPKYIGQNKEISRDARRIDLYDRR